MFLDYDLPNIWTLKKKKDEIKRDALEFVKDNIDLFKRVYLSSQKAGHMFCVMALFIRFMPEITDLSLRHYIDLYLLMFHIMMLLDGVEGSERDKSAFSNVLLTGYGWYDCIKTGERFIRDIGLKGHLKEYSLRHPPHEGYVTRLKDAVRRMSILTQVSNLKTQGSINEEDLATFTSLIFTDNLLYLFDDLNEGMIKDVVLKNKDNISSFIKDRVYWLFGDAKEEEEIGVLNSRVESIINEKAHGLITGHIKGKDHYRLLQQQQIETL